ncbi:hypothetical protein [Mesorhizobium sp.]|uniref:hypothetical protein n=1 Tax=Mesorhizobium sp. TaxID=1871066 RepID=UPI000FE45C24|nr:MAG: hypothetical protein EOS14_02785 [Mesorhizobium sp.]
MTAGLSRLKGLIRWSAASTKTIATKSPGGAITHYLAWGAGSNGITFVNVVPEGARISALVDVSPHKQERFAPGTGTAVVGPESLRGRPVRSIIVMTALSRRSCPGGTQARSRARYHRCLSRRPRLCG